MTIPRSILAEILNRLRAVTRALERRPMAPSRGGCTEAEAAGCFCPHQRIVWARLGESEEWTTTGSPPFNVARIERTGEVLPVASCMGSRCMAWRWADDQRAEHDRRGCCGLAGGQ